MTNSPLITIHYGTLPASAKKLEHGTYCYNQSNIAVNTNCYYMTLEEGVVDKGRNKKCKRGVGRKPLVPYRLCPPSSDGYLVEWKLEKLWMALAAENALNSPQRTWDRIRESSNTRGVNCKVCWTHGWFQTINLYIYSTLYLHLKVTHKLTFFIPLTLKVLNF